MDEETKGSIFKRNAYIAVGCLILIAGYIIYAGFKSPESNIHISHDSGTGNIYNARLSFDPRDPDKDEKITVEVGAAKYIDIMTSEPVKTFREYEGSAMHLTFIDFNLSNYMHIHANEIGNGSFTAEFSLPEEGFYKVYPGFSPAQEKSGTEQLGNEATINTSNAPRLLTTNPELTVTKQAQLSNGSKIDLIAPETIKVNEKTVLNVRSENGEQLFQPYHGSYGLLTFFPNDKNGIYHGFSTLKKTPTTNTASTEYTVMFPRPGKYKLFLDVRVGDTVQTLTYVVEVGE